MVDSNENMTKPQPVNYSSEPTDPQAADLVRYSSENSPQEAFKTIERAERHDMSPDSYERMSKELSPEDSIQERVPSSVHEKTKNYMEESANNSAAAEPDIGFMNTISSMGDHIKYEMFGKRDLENNIGELQDKLFYNGSLPDEEMEMLDFMVKERGRNTQAFGLTEWEQLPGQIAGVVGDVGSAMSKHSDKITAGGITGGAMGAISPLSPVTASAGWLLGTGAGATTAMVLDAYERISRSTFYELGSLKDEEGNPIELSTTRRQNMAVGLGLVTAGLEYSVGFALGKGAGKLFAKRAGVEIARSSLLRKALDLFGHTTKTAIIGGSEEIAGDFAEMVTKNYAKGDDSLGNIINSIFTTVDQIQNDPELQKQLLMTGIVGAGAGKVMAGTTGATALVAGEVQGRRLKRQQARAVEAQVRKQKNTVAVLTEAEQSVIKQQQFEMLSKVSMETNMKAMSPEQMTKFRQSVFEEYEGNLYFNEKDIADIEQVNPEIAAQLREMDRSGSIANGTGSGASIKPHEFLNLVDDFPAVSEYMRLNPEAPNPLESKTLLKTFEEAQTKRQEILESLGGKAPDPEQTSALLELDDMIEGEITKAGHQQYVEETATFSEAIEGVISDKQVASFNKSQRNAREAVADQQFEEFNAREERTEKRILKANKKILEQEQQRELSEEIRVTDLYKIDRKAPRIEAHKKANHPALAIDPESLPPGLKEAYMSDPKLTKRKVFVEGGITLIEAASEAEVESGEVLLKLLANAPTTAEMKAEIETKLKGIREQITEVRGKDVEARFDKVFDDLSKLHREEIKFMRSKEWGSAKQGFRKIMLPLPNIGEIQIEARNTVDKTRVGDLSPRQFRAAERRAQSKAASHILKNEVESAFMSKETAILNNELTRESIKATRNIEQAKKAVKRIIGRKSRANLKSAGLLDRVNEITDLFELLGSQPKGRKKDAYFDYLRSLDDKGESVIASDELSDVAQVGADLTVEQYLRVTDKLKSIEHQAKLKNKLLKKQDKRIKQGKLDTIEAISTEAAVELQEHPTYDENRQMTVENKNSVQRGQNIKEMVSNIPAFQTNFKNVVLELDGEKFGGTNQENLVEPMNEAELFERTRSSETVEHVKNIIEDYGEDSYVKAFNEEILIPEFKNIRQLGDGNMVKADLWRLLSYFGDPGGKKRLENYKYFDTKESLTSETIMRVLERELDVNDAKLTQNFVNIFKSFEQEAKELHERDTGVTPTMVKGTPFEFNGVMMDGGYVPIDLLGMDPADQANRFLDMYGDQGHSMFSASKKDGKMHSKLRGAEMTDQGRLVDRAGTTRPLDPSFSNFIAAYEEHIHDLAYREAGSDVLKLLRNETYKNAIINTVGEAKYSVLVDGVIDTVGRNKGQDLLNPGGKWSQKIMNGYKTLEQGFNIGVLGFNPSSVAMQPLSIGAAVMRAGPSSVPYITKAFGQAALHLMDGNYQEFFDKAAEINPDLKLGRDSVDETLTQTAYKDIIPDRDVFFKGKKTVLVRNAQKKVNEVSMLGLKNADLHVKVAITVATYGQFIDGKVENFPHNRLNKMSPSEIDVAAKKYSKQIADLALTTSATIDKTAAEKIAFMRIATRFYTDLRSQQNTLMSQGRKFRNSSLQGMREGDAEKRKGHFKSAALTASTVVLATSMMRLYMDTSQNLINDRDDKTPLNQLKNVNSLSDFASYMGQSTAYVLGSPVKMFTQSTLIARDIDFAVEGRGNIKRFNLPMNRMFSDFSTSIDALTDMLHLEMPNKRQAKAIAMSASYIGGGLPVNGFLKWMRLTDAEDKAKQGVSFLLGQYNELGKASDDYIEQTDDQEIKDNVQDIKSSLVPADQQNIKTEIPEDSMEVLKMNKWNEVNPQTGAAGIYQFTEERWNEIIEANPDLVFTDDGRVSMDTAQQEKAMKRANIENARGLAAYGEDITNSNLYGAHRFGLDDYVAVALSNNSEKLTEIVADMKLFEGFSTVGQVKKYVKKQVVDK